MSPVFTLLSFSDPSPLFLVDILSTNSLDMAKSCTYFILNVQYLLALYFVCL